MSERQVMFAMLAIWAVCMVGLVATVLNDGRLPNTAVVDGGE